MEHQSSASLKEAANEVVGESFIVTKDDFEKVYDALDNAWQQAIADSKTAAPIHRPLHEQHRKEFKEALDVMAKYHKPY